MEVTKSFDDVRVAHAIAIIKARRCAPNLERERHWKKKAKVLKDEILALKQDLRSVEDSSTLEKLPCLAPCECLFLNTRLQETPRTTDSDELISKLSVQRFLKNVRILNRAKKNGPSGTADFTTNTCASDLKENLALVVDFMVDLLADPTPVPDKKYFSTYIHQSVKFIKDAMPLLLADATTPQLRVETSVKKLTSALTMNIMNFRSQEEIEAKENIDQRVWNQQIILELASVPHIGQQYLLAVSRLIAEISETLVCVDPFHEGVAQTYNNLFFLMQLFEKLLSVHLCAWAKTLSFDQENLEESVRYHFQTVKLFQEFTDWSSLVVFYNDRITGTIITQLYKIVALNHKAEGSKHSALLRLVESATSTAVER